MDCLQGYIRRDSFVFGAQPLHRSLLVLCWHNKTLLLRSWSASVSHISAWDSHNISWGLICRDCGDSDLSPPLLPGCIPWTTRRRSHQVPVDSLIQRRNLSSQRVKVKASEAQWNQWGEESTACQTGKNLGLNSGLPWEAEGETGHLPGTPSNPIWGETRSLRFRKWGKRVWDTSGN
jgi:hypothetical protein